MIQRIASFAVIAFAITGCSSSTQKPATTAPQPPPATTVPRAAASNAAAPSMAPANQRQAFLERFARGYYPGRSGQIFIVPREGDIITQHDPLYAFMHGSPWSYDSRIPVLFYGPPFIRQTESASAVTQQDVAPTLAAVLGIPPPATVTGHALRDALSTGTGRPRVIALLVFDAMRVDYFDRYADAMPTLTRLRKEGAWFSQARINYLPTVTSVGHATIGTGTDPRFHGQSSNNLFNAATGKPQQAYNNLDPRELMVLTLADLWNLETEGRAVIIGQGGAIRATAGLVGHGACIVGGKKVMGASYSTADAGWETNPTCYRMPDSLKAITGKRYWEEAGGKWMGHDISNPTKFRASSLFQRFEGEALLTVIEHEAIGADDITDLVLVNMKGPDYTGHAYGPDSAEIKETLSELDRQMTGVVAALERKAGLRQTVIAITADHGMPSEPPAGHRRLYFDEVVAAINRRFDPQGKVVRYFDDPANMQIYMDPERLRTLGISLTDVARFLETLPYIAAAFTEDEVRAAGQTLTRQ
jgi:predicted AlkP superfamily pyrophosphatase or phosphodiesterase